MGLFIQQNQGESMQCLIVLQSNNQLISGPDLTNQLVGVLTRFREKQKQVAFIANVEAMFQQIRVPRVQRSLLRSLWWENRDITNPLDDNEMCVYLFAGISSSSCSNYSLKRTHGSQRVQSPT